MTIFLKSKHKVDISDIYVKIANIKQVLTKFLFLAGGGGYSRVVKAQSPKSCPNFYGEGGGHSTAVKLRIGILDKMSKNFDIPNSGIPSIAHSLSHTTCVGTNKPVLGIEFVANVARMKSVTQ